MIPEQDKGRCCSHEDGGWPFGLGMQRTGYTASQSEEGEGADTGKARAITLLTQGPSAFQPDEQANGQRQSDSVQVIKVQDRKAC